MIQNILSHGPRVDARTVLALGSLLFFGCGTHRGLPQDTETSGSPAIDGSAGIAARSGGRGGAGAGALPRAGARAPRATAGAGGSRGRSTAGRGGSGGRAADGGDGDQAGRGDPEEMRAGRGGAGSAAVNGGSGRDGADAESQAGGAGARAAGAGGAGAAGASGSAAGSGAGEAGSGEAGNAAAGGPAAGSGGEPGSAAAGSGGEPSGVEAGSGGEPGGGEAGSSGEAGNGEAGSAGMEAAAGSGSTQLVCASCGGCEEIIPVSPDETHTEDPIDYPDRPPTSGPHSQCWSAWGVPSIPVLAERWVHNLEHGGIVYLYNCPDGCDADVATLTSLVAAQPRTLLTEWGLLPTRFAAVSWGHRLLVSCVDVDAFSKFYAANFDHAPESTDADPDPSCAP